MARSNTGGTRGYLRGRVANDLYQVTRNESGKKIQLVRAVEEQRTNNNTLEQALHRQCMALLMLSLKELKQIIDHSFEGIPYGQLSISHFVSINMPVVKADQRLYWASENKFVYPVKGLSVFGIGPYILAEGSLLEPDMITAGVNYDFGTRYPFHIDLKVDAPTVGDLKRVLGVAADDYITLLTLAGVATGSGDVMAQKFFFRRFYINSVLEDSAQINHDTIDELFYTEGNTTFSLQQSTDGRGLDIILNMNPDGFPRDCIYAAKILSAKQDGVWRRCPAQFVPANDMVGLNLDEASPRMRFPSWYGDCNLNDPRWDDYPL